MTSVMLSSQQRAEWIAQNITIMTIIIIMTMISIIMMAARVGHKE